MIPTKIVPGSFRDPSGFPFFRNSSLFRQINLVYREHYDQLLASGLYERLVVEGLLIPHEEVGEPPFQTENAYKVIRPELIPFISYPYEWCFSQLKDAALTTLRIQRIALEYNMSLKDCSAYNIQFHNGKPAFIDTLSFEILPKGRPWIAYRQYCQHFLGPLALMAYKDLRLNQLQRCHIDGIPLELTTKMLPARTRFVPSLLAHIHLHAKSQSYFGQSRVPRSRFEMSLNALHGLVDNLENAVQRLNSPSQKRPGVTTIQRRTTPRRDSVTRKKSLKISSRRVSQVLCGTLEPTPAGLVGSRATRAFRRWLSISTLSLWS